MGQVNDVGGSIDGKVARDDDDDDDEDDKEDDDDDEGDCSVLAKGIIHWY